MNHHLRAILTALFVTLLWSSSWVLIKIGLKDLPALSFAGLRYSIAFLCLLPWVIFGRRKQEILKLNRANWLSLAALGIICYTVTQGTQFLGLRYMPAIITSLMLSFTTVLVAVLGMVFLKEQPTWLQWAGTITYLLGALIFLLPVNLDNTPLIGFIIVGISVVANSVSSILGRAINRARALDPLIVTVVSMGVGGVLLLLIGLITQGIPPLTLTHWLIILWLALVNSALAFTLWNHSLRSLNAVESSIINNTMLFQIALLAWIFLDEPLSPRALLGLVIAGTGTFLVQFRTKSRQNDRPGKD